MLTLVVSTEWIRKAITVLLLLPLLGFASSGPLEFVHPIEESPPIADHTHTASAVDAELLCVEEGHHGNHNCLHTQYLTSVLKLIPAVGRLPVLTMLTVGDTSTLGLCAIQLPPLRGPPLS